MDIRKPRKSRSPPGLCFAHTGITTFLSWDIKLQKMKRKLHFPGIFVFSYRFSIMSFLYCRFLLHSYRLFNTLSTSKSKIYI